MLAVGSRNIGASTRLLVRFILAKPSILRQ